jgi:hypothetical protein
MIGLVDRATVYTENPVTGVYDVVAKQNLRCRLEHVGGGQTVAARAELMQIRHLVFDIAYEMPEDCEVLIDGTRYNPQAGTFARHRGTNSRKAVRAVDVTEVAH